MNQYVTLDHVKPGESAMIHSIQTKDSMRRRLMDIGLVKDTQIECVGRSPGGDPSAFLIRGAVIAIRSEDCRHILIR